MEDTGRVDWRHWANFDQHHVKDQFSNHVASKLMEALAERDAAIAARDAAIAERKAALAERDAALLQRDNAYAERNAALLERDNAFNAIQVLRARKNSQDLLGKSMQLSVFSEMPLLALPPISHEPVQLVEPQHLLKQGKSQRKQSARKHKGLVAQDLKPTKTTKKRCKQQNQLDIAKHKQVASELAKAQIPYEISIPYCSCTGNNQQCYRWGDGGWQSACCTKFISSFPLPMNAAKQGARIAGRKMSGGAFKKLLAKLQSEGQDVTAPIDLKNQWAKHGTNGYVTIR